MNVKKQKIQNLAIQPKFMRQPCFPSNIRIDTSKMQNTNMRNKNREVQNELNNRMKYATNFVRHSRKNKIAQRNDREQSRAIPWTKAQIWIQKSPWMTTTTLWTRKAQRSRSKKKNKTMTTLASSLPFSPSPKPLLEPSTNC